MVIDVAEIRGLSQRILYILLVSVSYSVRHVDSVLHITMSF